MKRKRKPGKTPEERQRARTVRLKLKAKAPVSIEDRKFLLDYDSTKQGGHHVNAPAAQPTGTRSSSEPTGPTGTRSSSEPTGTRLEEPTTHGSQVGHSAPGPSSAPDDDDEEDEDDDEDDDDEGEAAPASGRRTIDFGEGEGDDADPVDAHGPIERRCPVKNCPECKTVAGMQTCGTTGRRVWEPIDDDECEAFGSMIFGGIGFAARIFRKDHARVRPTEREKKRMTKAVRKVTHRRMNAIGEWSDLVLATVAIGGFTGRAFTAPGELPKPGDDEDDDDEDEGAANGAANAATAAE